MGASSRYPLIACVDTYPPHPWASRSLGPPLSLRFRGGGIRARLLVLVALAAVPLIAATLWSFAIERRDAVARAQDNLRRLVVQAEVQHRAVLSEGMAALELLTLIPAVVDGNRTACEEALARASHAAPNLLNPTRVSARGVIDCAPGRSVGAEVRANPRFGEAMRADSAVIGPYMRSVSIPEPVVPLNRAMHDGAGRAVGVLSIGVRMRWLDTLASRLSLPAGAVVSMMDVTGLVLARAPDDGHVGERYENVQFTKILNSGSPHGVTEGAGVDGVRRWVAFQVLPSPADTRVGLAIAVPLSAITASVDEALRLRLALLLASLLLAGVIAWNVATPLVLRDLQMLTNAAEHIGTGDFTARTGVSRAPAELQLLARTIDDMADKLGEREERHLQAQKLESLGRLAGGVAHDYNNLLTAIMGHVEDVRDGLPPGSEERRNLDIALEAARRSGALSRQLLLFARRDDVAVTTVPLEPVLDETSQLLRRTLGTAITVVVDAQAKQFVATDRGRLEQALVNLALNARDAMPDGGTLTLASCDVQFDSPFPNAVGGPWVRLEVRDTGSGMTAEVQNRVFEPFFTTKPTGQGTGLGLAMVYATMQQFGGAATVQSEPGRGTSVTLWFPAVEPPLETPERARHSGPIPIVDGAHGRVLLADDEPAVRSFAARALRRAGYSVVEAVDGMDALRQVEASGLESFDLLVTDVVMPNMGGIALAEALRARRADLPILLITGFAGDQRPGALLATPHTRLLEKPFGAAAFLKAVDSLRP